ncbi:hypothetical protein [Nocardia panacis]|uniref:hypothetical protein n=1 Tax=Nocardia panacis TaxID=2340916 RepID=UPI00131547BE|nr:hypothetical protein [Nocardia panacis]
MAAISRTGMRNALPIATRLLAAALTTVATLFFGYLLLHQDTPDHQNHMPPPSFNARP